MAKKKGVSMPKPGEQPQEPIRLPVECSYCKANSWEVWQKIAPRSAQWLELWCKACGKLKNL